MSSLDTSTRLTLEACGCSEEQIDQVAALCACGCTQEAILRLRHHRADLVEDLHERQACVDELDGLIRAMRKNA